LAVSVVRSVADCPAPLGVRDLGVGGHGHAGNANRAGPVGAPSRQPAAVFGDPVVISGDLRFPSGTGPFPAVILAHGCGGIQNAETGWASVLREWGYATFVIDSFRGRNLTEVCTSAGTLTAAERIPDAYGALRILATYPKIDGRRVGLMGFSHGGGLTMGASTTWAPPFLAF